MNSDFPNLVLPPTWGTLELGNRKLDSKSKKIVADGEKLAKYVTHQHGEFFGPTGSGLVQYIQHLMLIDLVWLPKGLPESHKTAFRYQLNPGPAETVVDKRILRRILKYRQYELEFICGKLKKPEWAARTNPLRGKTCLFEAQNAWADILFAPFVNFEIRPLLGKPL